MQALLQHMIEERKHTRSDFPTDFKIPPEWNADFCVCQRLFRLNGFRKHISASPECKQKLDNINPDVAAELPPSPSRPSAPEGRPSFHPSSLASLINPNPSPPPRPAASGVGVGIVQEEEKVPPPAPLRPPVPSPQVQHELERFPRMWRTVPERNKEKFVSFMRTFFQEYSLHSSALDTNKMNDSLVGLTLLVRKALPRPHGGGKKRALKDLTRHQDRLLALLHDFNLQYSANDDDAAPSASSSSLDLNEAKVNGAMAWFAQGLVARASAALQNSPAVELTPEIRTVLRQLHPSAESNFHVPPLPRSDPSPVVVDTLLLRKIIRRAKKGTAPGPSGWTYELLDAVASDSVCLRGLADIVADLLAGRVGDSNEMHTLLNACRTVPVPKDAQSPRPISICDIFYKLAALYAFALVPKLDFTTKIFPRIQMAVATPGGCERCLHLLQAALDAHSEYGLLLIDFKSAFQNISRSAMLKAVLSCPWLAPIHTLFRWSYGRPSPLLVYAKDGTLLDVISSEQGGKQGDPLMGVGFAVTVQPIYEEALDVNPNTVGAAYEDDFGVAAPPSVLLEIFASLCENSSKINLTVNTEKCRLLCPSVDEALQQQMKELSQIIGVPLCQDTWIPWLGGVIGDVLDPAVSEWCVQQVRALDPLFDSSPASRLLLHPKLSIDAAFQIVRESLLPKLGYLARVLPPPTTDAALQLLDEMALKFVQAKLKSVAETVTFTDVALTQMVLPISGFGGLGFIAQCPLRSIAFFSSLALAAPVLLPFFLSSRNIRTFRLMEASLDAIHGTGIPPSPSCPETLEEAMDAFCKNDPEQPNPAVKLQHVLSTKLHTIDRDMLLHSIGDNDLHKLVRVRLQAAGGPHASHWLTALNQSNSLPDSAFVLACCLRLGCSIVKTEVQCPACFENISGPEDTFAHLCSCKKVYMQVDMRHNMLRDVFAKRLAEYGFAFVKEPHNIQEAHHVRPDLIVFGLDKYLHQPLWLDFTIVHPTATSFLDSVSVDNSAALSQIFEKRVTDKVNKFKQAAQADAAIFKPLVFASYGSCDETVIEVVSALAAEIKEVRGQHKREQFITDLFTDCSLVLQNGNAQIAKMGFGFAAQAGRR